MKDLQEALPELNSALGVYGMSCLLDLVCLIINVCGELCEIYSLLICALYFKYVGFDTHTKFKYSFDYG